MSQQGGDHDQDLMNMILERNPAGLSAAQIAAAARIPMTLIGSRLRETIDETALTAPQSLVLSQLTTGDALPITELAAADGRAISTMTEIVGRLAKAGLVRKHNAIEDKRQVLVTITDAGREALAASRQLRNEWLAARVSELSEHERVSLAAALPALWKIAEVEPHIWPRLNPRADQPRRRRRAKPRD